MTHSRGCRELQTSRCCAWIIGDDLCMCTIRTAGEPCEKEHSTCGGRNELCIGRGPAWEADDHGFASNSIIAGRQAERARSLFEEEDGPALDVTGA